MRILSIIDAWFFSMKTIFNEFQAVTKYDKSDVDVPGEYCSLNIRINDYEADLVVWASGEAELVVGEVGGRVEQIHYDDLENREGLFSVLSRLTDFIVVNRPR